ADGSASDSADRAPVGAQDAPRDRSDPRPGGAGGVRHSPVLEEARREADPQGAQVGGGERRAAGAARERRARRGPPARQIRGGERRADPEAVHAGGEGPGHSDPQADERRGKPRGGRGGDARAQNPARKTGGREGGGRSPVRTGGGEAAEADQGQEGGQGHEEEREQVSGPESTPLRVPARDHQAVALAVLRPARLSRAPERRRPDPQVP